MKTILLIEPGDLTRKPILEGIKKADQFDLVVATGFPTEASLWVKEFCTELISFQYSNKNSLIQKLKHLDVKGIICYFDLCLEFANSICQKLNLPKIFEGETSPANKIFQRECFDRNKIKNTNWRAIANLAEAKKAEFDTFPAIVKPAQMTASLGVKKVHNISGLRKAIIESLNADFADENVRNYISNISSAVIVEKYIEGTEFSAECFVQNSAFNLIGLTKKLKQPQAEFDEPGHVFPHLELENELKRHGNFQKLHSYLRATCEALGLQNCMVHIELKSEENELSIIEVNPRFGGSLICELINLSGRFSFYENLIKLATGETISKIDLEETSHNLELQHSCLWTWTTCEGVIKTLPKFRNNEAQNMAPACIVHNYGLGQIIARYSMSQTKRLSLGIFKGDLNPLPEADAACFELFLGTIEISQNLFYSRFATAKEIDELTLLESKVWGSLAAENKTIRARIEANPESTICCHEMSSNKIVGFLTIVHKESAQAISNWETYSALSEDREYIAKHKHSGFLFGLNITVENSSPKGIGTFLFTTARKWMAKNNKYLMQAAIRCICMKEFTEAGGKPEQYLGECLAGNLNDSAFGASKNAGAYFREIIPNYYIDSDSLNYGIEVLFLPLKEN